MRCKGFSFLRVEAHRVTIKNSALRCTAERGKSFLCFVTHGTAGRSGAARRTAMQGFLFRRSDMHRKVDTLATARKWVWFYRSLGYQPLPSRPDAKRPLIKFADLWEQAAPIDLWDRNPSTNLQLMTGRVWRLAVIDLDGGEAIAKWKEFRKPCPRTWETESGGGGKHLWFSLPDGLPPTPRRRLWGIWDATARDGKGDWEKHKAIELLCDRSLVMAPPSVHPTTGRVYRFLPGCSPKQIRRPALMPRWILDLPRVEAPRPAIEVAEVVTPRPFITRPKGSRPDPRAVLDAIPSKAGVAKSWGLRFASDARPAKGWVSVHDFNRADANPSAQFNILSGRFWRPGEQTMSLFDLGAAMGIYATWQDCLWSLAVEYRVAPHH